MRLQASQVQQQTRKEQWEALLNEEQGKKREAHLARVLQMEREIAMLRSNRNGTMMVDHQGPTPLRYEKYHDWKQYGLYQPNYYDQPRQEIYHLSSTPVPTVKAEPGHLWHPERHSITSVPTVRKDWCQESVPRGPTSPGQAGLYDMWQPGSFNVHEGAGEKQKKPLLQVVLHSPV